MDSQNPYIVALGLLLAVVIFATIPAVLNIVSRLLRAHYRGVMRWKPLASGASVSPAAETGNTAPDVPLVEAKHVPISSHPARGEAANVTHEMRIAHGIAAVVYVASVVTTIVGFSMMPLGTRLVMAYASLASPLLLLSWTWRLERRQKMWVFLIHAVTGAVLVVLVSGLEISVLWAAAAVALLIVPALLLLIDRVIEPFVILLVPVLFVIFGVGIMLDRAKPEMIIEGEKVLKGLHWWILISGIGSAIAGFYLVRALLQKGWAVRVTAGALALIAVLVLNPTNDRPVSHAVGVAGVIGAVVLQMLVVGALFQLLVWLQDRHVLTNELLQTHVAWVLLTIYFVAWSWNTDQFIGLRWWFACAFGVWTVTLQMLLILLRRRRPVAKKRLLLLRAFGGPDERQDLLDDLRDTWRRVGAIDMIAAADVATGTLKPDMLAAYVLRRTGEHYLESEAAAVEWVKQHRAAIEGDARYPQNAAFCPNHVREADEWKQVFIGLARGADVILMDVRDFTEAHQGCKWEITTLRDAQLLHRVAFIANSATDGQLIAKLLPGHEIEMLDYQHRTKDERRALFDRLLDVAYA